MIICFLLDEEQYVISSLKTTFLQQECIPLGCVPSATVAVCFWGEVSTPTPWQQTPLGADPPQEQTPWEQTPPEQTPRQDPPRADPREQTTLQIRPPPGDLLQGMLGYHLQGMLGYCPPPRGQTDTCKNITFTTSLRTVITPNPNQDVEFFHSLIFHLGEF